MTPVPGSKPDPGKAGFKVSTKEGRTSIEVPHTDKGREFIRLLHEFCDAKKLPFKKVARSSKTEQPLSLAASEGATADTGSTAYSLDMRIDQEGWPP